MECNAAYSIRVRVTVKSVVSVNVSLDEERTGGAEPSAPFGLVVLVSGDEELLLLLELVELEPELEPELTVGAWPLPQRTTIGLEPIPMVSFPATRRRASQDCSQSEFPLSGSSGSSQPVAVRTASKRRSLESPPASQMENPRSPSERMNLPFAAKASGES